MKSKLSLAQRLELIQAYQNGEKVSNLCRKFAISRVLFYRLLKRYNLSNSQKAALLPKKAKVERFVRQLPPRVEQSILKTVACDPTKSVSQLHTVLSPTLKVSRHAIQNVLLRNNLNKRELRLQFATDHKGVIRQNPSGLSPRDRRIMFDMVKRGITISEVCRKFGISRVIFYRLRKRYETAGRAFSALEDKERKVERFGRQAPGEVEEKIKQIVISNPLLSSHKISAFMRTQSDVPVLGNHGVHNVLKRLDLNTIDKRILFAQGSAASLPKVKVAPLYTPTMPMYRLRMLLAPFVTIPKLLLTKPKKGIWYLLFGILPLVIFAFWTRLLLTAPSGTSLIGLIFASIALTFGLFFFLYSLKYYLTILMVLRLAQSGAVAPDSSKFNPSSTESRRGREVQSSKLGKLLSKLFKSQNQSRVNPLLVNLEKVELSEKPFVSIHVATYNEKNVIERLIRAVSSQNWPSYEVIICDDSNDETTEIAVNTLKEIYKELNTTQIESATIYKTTPTDKNQPAFALIHRQDRYGYKGGALQKALEATDPRAEYIVVFDADFVPYPDTVEQFVKTFQVLAPNNAESAPISAAPISADISENQRGSRIAAVQGYQWHVLNKSENWITRGVRTEYAGSYVIERSGEEIYQGLKQIAGSVYCIRADILRAFGWGTSITEDFELTLRLYEAGYKIAFTPYIQAPAEAVSTVRRLIRQRMRWAEGASFNVKVMLSRMLFGKWEVRSENMDNEVGNETEPSNLSPQNPASHLQPLTSRQWVPSRLTPAEKLEFAYLAPYYLQAAFLVVGTLSWFLSEAVFQTRLPFWTAAFGWSLVFTNLLSLPLMNIIGLFLEESDERDYVGILSFIALSYIVVPFQAYAVIKGFLERSEGPWFRTPKTGAITDAVKRISFFRFGLWPFGSAQGKPFGRPAPAPITADEGRLALNFASAYNNFGNQVAVAPVAISFKIRRRLPYLGKLLIVLLLTLAISINYFAFLTPAAYAFGSDRTFSDNTTINTTKTGNAAGSSGNATLTVASVSGFVANDRVLIIQMTGTGAGNFEERTIASVDVPTQTVTLTENKTNTYTNDASSKAQMIKAEINNSVTVNSGVTVTATAWGGTIGGVIYYIANSFTVNSTGIVDMNGKGFSKGSQVSGGGGGAGGYASSGSGGSGGTSGNAGSGPGAGNGGTAVNNPGGGGTLTPARSCGGGGAGGSAGGGAGGSYGAAASNGSAGASGSGGAGGNPLGACTAGSAGTGSAGSGGTAGSTYGNADADFSGTTCNGGTGCLFLGSGGGSGGSGSGGGGGAGATTGTGGTGGDGGIGAEGGTGGGIIYISTNTFSNSGTVRASGNIGGAGGNGSIGGTGTVVSTGNAAGGGGGANGAGGGGGSGGSLWLSAASSMTLGTANTTGGSAGSGSSTGGNGGSCSPAGGGDGGGGGGYKGGIGGSTDCTAAGSDAAGTGSGAGAGSAGGVGRIKCDNSSGNPVAGCDNTEVATAPVPEYVIFGAPVVYFLPKLARRLKKLRILRRVIAMLAGH
ncbi:MAG: hypothetical protein UU56_C0018G0004 [Candidatus Curtissbacteria bacterium GW2011_GWA2_41_24]|uniref:Insertion element IS150 protein InsJ-like helix-turn-helix domain-containing protein n=1 Tax=Candidatus Curtissbacteria bacterium GW2011_GWA2_41_24 TaxID=1618411 RepID=A0A0G0Y2I7_9BACT|nr:MAG: hypothetical protein UU56_C0018G0004 [Candidatus Curtissbacteria bacterium GW2011_GWA2_41_24]